MTTGRRRCHDDYTVGWICALPVEMAAARVMLDEVHEDLPVQPNDHNSYALGKMENHNVVIACLPSGEYGIASATTVAMQLLSSFHSIRFGLIVGIGGGVPNEDVDIRLGDVVVSKPTDKHGGVVQYDYGTALSGGYFERTGMLNRPPQILLTALSKLQADHLIQGRRFMDFLADMERKLPPQTSIFARPTQEDRLYLANYTHAVATSKTCDGCDGAKLVPRTPRDPNEPIIHYGLIASANQLVKDSQLRDNLSQKWKGVYCVEMEAAGLMNNFPCLVVRGICDYADSHKNKEWQGYAAATAAAYAKELLSVTSVSHSVGKFHVPLDPTGMPIIENFLGRQDELDSLWHYFQPADSLSRKVAILHGLGGIGKTQVASRFVLKHKNDFTAIFWLNGKDRATLMQSLSSVLPRLPTQSPTIEAINSNQVEIRARLVLRWLAIQGNSHWLLIFDNIDTYPSTHADVSNKYDIREFFPAAFHGSILITTRLPQLTDLGLSFPIRQLEQGDAIELFLQSSGLSAKITMETAEVYAGVTTLASRLDGLPLAIVIAGAFIRETGTSIDEYLEYYESSWHDLQSQSRPRHDYPQGNMLQTWVISYDEVQKRDKTAAELLVLFAYFDNRDIWYELIQCGSHSPHLPGWLKRIVSNRLAFSLSMGTLINFSLIEAQPPGGGYVMHPVVQDWCRDGLANVGEQSQHKVVALASIGHAVPDSCEREYWVLQRRLLPHANQMYKMLLAGWDFPNDDRLLLSVNKLGDLYYHQGQFTEAEKMYRRAFAGYEGVLGPNHMSTLNTIKNLGNLYSRQGKLKNAEEMYRKALEGRNDILDLNDLFTLGIVNNLAIIYSRQKKGGEAVIWCQLALAGYENVLGPDHISTLNTMHNLGSLYSRQGKLDNAVNMYRGALEGWEKTLGLNHTFTIMTANNLGKLYAHQGKFHIAETIYQHTLTGYEKTLGHDHVFALTTSNNLGDLFTKQGKLKEAEEKYQQALMGYEKTLGHDHALTLKTIKNLEHLFVKMEKLKEVGVGDHQLLNSGDSIPRLDYRSGHKTSTQIESLAHWAYVSISHNRDTRELGDCEDVSAHITRGRYRQKLKWLSTKFVVLWDDEDKRGWLVNGTSALLHLLRVSLEDDRTNIFKDFFLLKQDELIEASKPYNAYSVVKALLDPRNRTLKLYASNENYVCLQDRAELLFDRLEKIIDFQLAESARHEWNSPLISQKCLEGWDFKDLATGADPLYPRVATRQPIGRGLVNWTRKIHAATLFGRGFGDIMQPADVSIYSQWASLPKGMFYLATCVSDIDAITADLHWNYADKLNSIERAGEIIWYDPDEVFQACQCAWNSRIDHFDCFPVILPGQFQFSRMASKKNPLQSEDHGTVVLRHSMDSKCYWKGSGDPENGGLEGRHSRGGIRCSASVESESEGHATSVKRRRLYPSITGHSIFKMFKRAQSSIEMSSSDTTGYEDIFA